MSLLKKTVALLSRPLLGKERSFRLAMALDTLDKVYFYKKSYFNETGWLQARDLHRPVSSMLRPIPWTTYSYIDFIDERLRKNMCVFEYGCGYSTLFYANKVGEVHGVEHNPDWYVRIKEQMPPKVKLYHFPTDNPSYVEIAGNNPQAYDIIVVDGRKRVDCLKACIPGLKPEGVIVLDDSERKLYREGKDFLKEEGFKHIDFWGIAPGEFVRKCTTIFYRPGNCLDI